MGLGKKAADARRPRTQVPGPRSYLRAFPHSLFRERSLNLGDQDSFELWRLLLAAACSVYAALVTLRSLWTWVVYFSGPDRQTTVMRQYLVVQLLRLRPGRFAWELVQIAFWSVLAIILLRLQL